MGMFFSINCWLLKVTRIWLFSTAEFWSCGPRAAWPEKQYCHISAHVVYCSIIPSCLLHWNTPTFSKMELYWRMFTKQVVWDKASDCWSTKWGLFCVVRRHETAVMWCRDATLTLIMLTWKIRWAPNNASRWQVGFNSAFRGLNHILFLSNPLFEERTCVILISGPFKKKDGRPCKPPPPLPSVPNLNST
jgi:hypothetical protein